MEIIIKKRILLYVFLAIGLTSVFGCKKTGEDIILLDYTVEDIDGNVYKTVRIGSQMWMAENLRTTKYQNGDAIQNILDDSEWIKLTLGAYCNYKNTTNEDTIATFGRLYNWYTISDIRNVAPKGWHVPTDEEWLTLINFLGGESVAGGKLKESGTSHWTEPNTGATNESYFSGLGGGVRSPIDGTVNFMNIYGIWWTSNSISSTHAYCRSLYHKGEDASLAHNANITGYSIRCIKN